MEYVKWQKVERISQYNPQNERVNQSFRKQSPGPLIICFWLLQLECCPSQKWLFSSQPHSVLAPFTAPPPHRVSRSIRSFTQIPVPAAYSFRRGRGMLWGVSGGTSPLRWWGRAWKLWPLWVTEVDKDTFWPIVNAAADKTIVLDMYTQWYASSNIYSYSLSIP